MALKKTKRAAEGIAYEGVAAHWRTEVGDVIIVAENMSALDAVCQLIDPRHFDPEIAREVGVFKLESTKEAA